MVGLFWDILFLEPDLQNFVSGRWKGVVFVDGGFNNKVGQFENLQTQLHQIFFVSYSFLKVHGRVYLSSNLQNKDKIDIF